MNNAPHDPPRFGSVLTAIGIAFSLQAAAAPITVTDSVIATDETTGVRIVKGTIELPRKEAWYIANPFLEQGGLIEIYLNDETDDIDEEVEVEGPWAAKMHDYRTAQERRMELMEVYEVCRNYARKSDGRGPTRLSDLKKRHQDLSPYTPPDQRTKPDQPDQDAPAKITSGVHLVPNVQILPDGDRPDDRIESKPLLIDRTPAIADGKHWIVYPHRTGAEPWRVGRGFAERVVIDPEFIETLGIVIKPQAPPQREGRKDVVKSTSLTIYARLAGDPGAVTLEARDADSKKRLEIKWDTASAKRGTDEICNTWAEMRLWYLDHGLRPEAPIGRTWAVRIAEQYDLEESDYIGSRPDLFEGPQDRGSRAAPAPPPRPAGAEPAPRPPPPPFRGRTANIVGAFGGRAAIRETLQLRNIRAAAENEADWKPSLPIDGIAGVQVQAHPFEKMLNGKPGGSLPLAEWIPADHLMAYLPQPQEVSALFDAGVKFLSQAGADVTGRSADYALKERYRDSFGLTEELLKRFLKTGAIAEMALIMPDLFLVEGTELSVIMRTGKPLLTTTALALVGVPPGDGKTVKKNRHGEPVYWVRRGPILIVSTSESEVQAILDAKMNGTGLGKSAELHYMLTQLPLTKETVFFTYFSDPFIRSLVSPRTKIGQLRRIFARAELEEASAASLLAAFDGHGQRALHLPFLQEKGYMQGPVYAADLKLDQRAVSSSGFYGSAARMTSLTAQPLDLVSPVEKRAYDDYLDTYNRFWRRYFDPIAIRYEQKADGQHEVETFILPLIENSLYGGLRGLLPPAEEQVPLLVPVMKPAPIAMVSCTFNDEAWLGALEGIVETMEEFLNLDSALVPHLGPDVHFALHDADPIITIGNGELQGMLGSFGGGELGAEAGWIGALVSILTRPCTVHIGLQDPAAVRALLGRMTWPPDGRNINAGVMGVGSLYKIAGRNKWVYTYSIEDIITFRFGIEVQDRYLVISNFPFSNKAVVTGNKQAPYGAAYLELNPFACQKQLPALFHSALQRSRINAMSGAACLLPLFAAGESGLAAAQQRHRELFGFAPLHPRGGSWAWDSPQGELHSSLYGSPWRNEQPGFDPDAEHTGLLRNISQVNLGMQFEQDGLRSKVRWQVEKRE